MITIPERTSSIMLLQAITVAVLFGAIACQATHTYGTQPPFPAQPQADVLARIHQYFESRGLGDPLRDAHYFVDPRDGDDDGSGRTPHDPWKSIAYANTHALADLQSILESSMAGEAPPNRCWIWLLGDVYTDECIDPQRPNGATGRIPLCYASVPGKRARLTTTAEWPTNKPALVTIRTHNIGVRGIELDGARENLPKAIKLSGVLIAGGHDNVIEDVVCHDTTWHAILVRPDAKGSKPQGNLITGCEISHCTGLVAGASPSHPRTDLPGIGILLRDAGPDNSITKCDIHHNGGDGIQSVGPCPGLRIHRNVIYGHNEDGIDLKGGPVRATVTENLIFGNRQLGIVIQGAAPKGSDATTGGVGILIESNAILNNLETGIWVKGSFAHEPDPALRVDVRFNLISREPWFDYDFERDRRPWEQENCWPISTVSKDLQEELVTMCNGAAASPWRLTPVRLDPVSVPVWFDSNTIRGHARTIDTARISNDCTKHRVYRNTYLLAAHTARTPKPSATIVISNNAFYPERRDAAPIVLVQRSHPPPLNESFLQSNACRANPPATKLIPSLPELDPPLPGQIVRCTETDPVVLDFELEGDAIDPAASNWTSAFTTWLAARRHLANDPANLWSAFGPWMIDKQ